jgi:hypothetical protein
MFWQGDLLMGGDLLRITLGFCSNRLNVIRENEQVVRGAACKTICNSLRYEDSADGSAKDDHGQSGEIVWVEREDDKNGKWNYEVVVKTDGKEWDLRSTQTGNTSESAERNTAQRNRN